MGNPKVAIEDGRRWSSGDKKTESSRCAWAATRSFSEGVGRSTEEKDRALAQY